ncbi:MAG: xanthine dehydrogenase family protein subunit M [Bacillota bacterium]|nr:MAG: xanthine dehydrogenase family protein subunit M [Bacillota bacterium]
MVEHVIPKTLREALEIINDGSFMLLAGGTDLMIQHRSSAHTPPHFNKNVCYLSNLKELKYITKDTHHIHIGAMTTFEEILSSPLIPLIFKDVIRDIASQGIRHLATLAGNIANASPAGDSLVYLYAMDAWICIESLKEQRICPITEVIIGPRKTTIKPNEIIKEIMIPVKQYHHCQWVKVGPRKADAISKVSFVGLAQIENEILKDCSFAFGAIYKTVLSKRDIDKTLIGLHTSQINQKLDEFIHLYEPWIQPIDDLRSNKNYRKQVAINLLRDFLLKLQGK